jgi:hypothetical protein
MRDFVYCCFLGRMRDTSCLCTRSVILVKLIFTPPLSSLTHRHIIESAHTTAYLVSSYETPTETGLSVSGSFFGTPN